MADLVEYRQDNPGIAYERTDWRLGPVGWVFLAIVAFLATATLVMIWAYPKSLDDTDRRLAVEPPLPRLQTDGAADYARFRADEERKLNTYYWIDKANGIVHIPIEEAMRKLATEGVAGFPQGQR